FIVHFALYALLLHRYSGQQTFSLATPVANRHRVEFEDILGFLVNTLVLPVEINERMTLENFLLEFAGRFDGFMAHAQLPYELVRQAVRDLQDSGDAAGDLFASMFSLEDVPRTLLDFGKCRFSLAQYEKHNSKFDLSLTVL